MRNTAHFGKTIKTLLKRIDHDFKFCGYIGKNNCGVKFIHRNHVFLFQDLFIFQNKRGLKGIYFLFIEKETFNYGPYYFDSIPELVEATRLFLDVAP